MFGVNINRRLMIFLAIVASATTARAENAGSYFSGKTITIVGGGSTGSVYDVYARLLARYLGKHIPGQPNVIVDGMFGANGETAAVYVARVAAKDGTYIASTTQAQPFEPVLRDLKNLKYDPTRVNYLGNASSDEFLCVVRRDAPVTNFGDAFNTQLIVGGTAPYGPLGYLALALNHVIKTKFKQVLGYPGSADIISAIQKSEIDGMCGISWTNVVPLYAGLINSGALRVLVQISDKGLPELNKLGVPLVSGFTHNEEEHQVLDIIASQGLFARPYFIAAEVPSDRVEVLRKAFMETWRDPDLLADAAKANLPVGPMPGEELQRLLEKIYASPPEIIKKVREAVQVN